MKYAGHRDGVNRSHSDRMKGRTPLYRIFCDCKDFFQYFFPNPKIPPIFRKKFADNADFAYNSTEFTTEPVA